MLSARKAGLAGGLIWGICMLITTIVSVYTGYAESFLTVIGSIYPGYTISWLGSFVGLLYGFLDAFIGIYLFAWIYNKLP